MRQVLGRAVAATNRGLERAGYELRWKPKRIIRSADELRMSVEFAIAHLATRRDEPLQVVQVGAFDGVTNDPVGDAIARFGCRAVLVEPQPGPYARLKERHKHNPDVVLLNVAIGDRDGERPFFTARPSPASPAWVMQLASFDRATIASHQEHLADDEQFEIVEILVETLSPDSLLRRSGVNTIDVLQIDAEGYDLELLRLFDVHRRRPVIVNFEHSHLSRADRNAAVDLLVSAGYKVAMPEPKEGDTVAYLL